jgi:hypothetical protein
MGHRMCLRMRQHIVHRPTAQCVESIRDNGRGRMLYLTAYRQHVSCVAVQRDAILGTLAILRTFAAYLRVAARLEWRLDRPGPINRCCHSRSET